MKQMKNKKLLIAIIILAVLIFLTIIGIVIMYFTTDILKSDKILFFKYLSQISDERIAQYYNKIQNTPYEDSGEFSVNVTSNGQDSETFKYTNDFNIEYEGKVDIANNKAEQNISINYSDDINFPINYRQINGIIGLQSQYVGSKYVAIEEGKKLSLEGYVIPEINLSKTSDDSNTSFDFVNNFSSKYANIIFTNLNDTNFSQVKDSVGNGYKLSLNGGDIKKILIEILNVFKDDKETIQKFTEDVDNVKKSVEGYIDNLKEFTDLENQNVEIIVYVKDKTLDSFVVKSNGTTINLKKTSNDNELSYQLDITLDDSGREIFIFGIGAKYSGLQSFDIVEENYEIRLGVEFNNSNSELQDKSKNLSVAEERESIQLLVADVKSSKLLQDQDPEKVSYDDIQGFLDTNTEEIYSGMNLDRESEDTYSITFKSTSDVFIIDVSGKIIQEPEENEEEQSNDTEEKNILEYKYYINNTNTFKDSIEIEELVLDNAVILTQEDSEYAKKLLDAITERIGNVTTKQMEELGVTNNLQNPILNINPISFLATSVIASASGQIQLSEAEVTAFNQKFEMYENSNQKGATTKGLLTVVQNNNESQTENRKIEEINFDGQENEVTEQNITLIKSNINVEDYYKVEFEKNQDTGLIYRVVINKK